MNDVVPLLKFTPSAQSPEVLEAITVQREPLIAALVDAALDTAGGLRHHLLVGPRGIGKTHILSLVASRVRAADPDARSVVVAWLDEDPWSIRTYGKFLAAIAAAVAHETGDAQLAAAAAELRRDPEGADGARGEELLRHTVDRRRLVLLAENLDEVFRRIGSEGESRFRAFAEDWGQMLVLATTPQLFAGVRRHASPFYGFFAIDHLDELSLESAITLMRRIADLRRDERLLQFLETDVARRRLAAVEALAGGHPRVWLLLAGCVSVPAIEELVPLFLEALDELTPYYQDRLRELGDQQQEIVVLLAEAGGALSNRALSEQSGIPQKQVATALRQLTERGYVRSASLPADLRSGDRRMSFWELREPLMRLCLDVKQARGTPLRIVVAFLRAWYGPRLLDELDRLPPTAELATAYACEAFRTLEVSLWGDDLMRGSAEEILARAERGLALRRDDATLKLAKATALLMQERYADALPIVEQLLALRPGGVAELALRVQIAMVRKALGMPFEGEQIAVEALELGRTGGETLPLAAVTAFAWELAGCDAEALEAFSLASDLDPGNVLFVTRRGVALSRLGRHAEALAAFDRAIELMPDQPAFHDSRGTTLVHMGRLAEALEAFARAGQLDPTNAWYVGAQGEVLLALGRLDEALSAYERALELDGSDARGHNGLGIGLAALGRREEALEAFLRAAELDPTDAVVRENCAIELTQLGRHEEALHAFEQAATLDPENGTLRRRISRLLELLGRIEDAVAAASSAVELDPEDPANHDTYADLLLQQGRFDQAQAAARRAVDLDGADPEYRFTLAAVVLAQGDTAHGISLVREALGMWREHRDGPAGEPELLCAILWALYPARERRQDLIAQLVAAYRDAGALEQLGGGVVRSISLFLDEAVTQERADAWVEDWAAAPFAYADIPVRMLEAARAWKGDRDQAHLLALPPEQRAILLELLPR